MKRYLVVILLSAVFFFSPFPVEGADTRGQMGHQMTGMGAAPMPEYPPMPAPGKKVPVGGGYYLIYGFDKQLKMGTVIMKVEVFTSDDKKETSLELKADADMPSMRGAHGTGDRAFKLSQKGDYLLPISIVMPGDWEVKLTVVKGGKVIFRGRYNFQCITFIRAGAIILALLLAPGTARADYLLYFEAQGVAGYSTEVRRPIYYSQNPDAEMQKPSVGFDYLQRISGETGDLATFALQGRLALTEDIPPGTDLGSRENRHTYTLEPQIYNAYVKVKTPLSYLWIGHNRPAFGLSSYFDSHGLILRTLAIQGFGYDRDWGGGLYRDFSWGDLSASVTTGSGMPIEAKGNYMTAARISYGVQSQDNFNLGFSLGAGNTLDTMGYLIRDPEPRQMRLASVDLTILRDNLEHRFDLYAGRWLDQDTFAASYRFGVNFDQEGRLKAEIQPTYWKFGQEYNYETALCLSSLITADLTVRLGYTYDHNRDDHRLLLQLYYYLPI